MAAARHLPSPGRGQGAEDFRPVSRLKKASFLDKPRAGTRKVAAPGNAQVEIEARNSASDA